ncbi:MAG: metallophosphoesterase [Bacteroides sp.]|nr:metallophosphoesterase [Bacillota bacterium]MCM1394347.1 metallophosphoesterase [[Eubacterium] siraeum]MCM1455039.1 metallophosphoesterase [Bacteroides sp.]
MKVFAISDLHLSSAVEKPMNIFGTSWNNHFEKICEDWHAKVGKDDLVLLGGDMSWGMTIDEAKPDYALVSELDGRKIVVKGNHDLYWNSLIKMQRNFPEFDFLQNNAYRITPPLTSGEDSCQSTGDSLEKGVVVAGTRGWTIPSKDTDNADLKIFNRELIRLELSLRQALKLRRRGDVLIVMLHYPPFEANFADTAVTQLLENYKVDYALYGHLHGKNVRVKPVVEKNGISYILTSCDLIDCKLVEVCEI